LTVEAEARAKRREAHVPLPMEWFNAIAVSRPDWREIVCLSG